MGKLNNVYHVTSSITMCLYTRVQRIQVSLDDGTLSSLAFGAAETIYVSLMLSMKRIRKVWMKMWGCMRLTVVGFTFGWFGLMN